MSTYPYQNYIIRITNEDTSTIALITTPDGREMHIRRPSHDDHTVLHIEAMRAVKADRQDQGKAGPGYTDIAFDYCLRLSQNADEYDDRRPGTLIARNIKHAEEQLNTIARNRDDIATIMVNWTEEQHSHCLGETVMTPSTRVYDIVRDGAGRRVIRLQPR